MNPMTWDLANTYADDNAIKIPRYYALNVNSHAFTSCAYGKGRLTESTLGHFRSSLTRPVHQKVGDEERMEKSLRVRSQQPWKLLRRQGGGGLEPLGDRSQLRQGSVSLYGIPRLGGPLWTLVLPCRIPCTRYARSLELGRDSTAEAILAFGAFLTSTPCASFLAAALPWSLD